MDNAMKKNAPYFTKIDESYSSRRIQVAWELKLQGYERRDTHWRQV